MKPASRSKMSPNQVSFDSTRNGYNHRVSYDSMVIIKGSVLTVRRMAIITGLILTARGMAITESVLTAWLSLKGQLFQHMG